MVLLDGDVVVIQSEEEQGDPGVTRTLPVLFFIITIVCSFNILRNSTITS